MRSLYIDPGIQCTGAALFHDGELVSAHMIRATDVAEAIRAAYLYRNLFSQFSPEHSRDATIEIPQSYGAARQKGDQNDLLSLALVAGAWAGLAVSNGVAVRYLRPAEWKGQVPKEKMHARLLGDVKTRQPGLLTAPERAVLANMPGPTGLKHNAYDAVCMGLVLQGRRA